MCLFSSTLKPSKYFEFAVHTAVLSIYEWLSPAKETTLLWCLLWSRFAFISAFSTGHMLTQPFKVLGRKDVSWILQNFSSVAEKSSLTFLFLHELSFNSLSVWFLWPKSGNFTKICCWYKSTFVITGHHHYLPTELWAQFFFFTMTFVRLKRKQSFHGHWSQRRNTSSTVRNPPHPPVCRVGELISSPSLMTQVDASDFFLLHQHFLKSSQKANEM